jgi:hypothetical protein
VLPWLTSFAIHAGLLAVGLLTYQSVKVLLHHQVQTAPAETPLLVSSVADGLNDGFPGDSHDSTRMPIQNQIDDPSAHGASWERGSERASLHAWDAGANAEPTADTLIGIGLRPSRSRSAGGTESGEAGGGLAQFGMAPQSGGSPNIFRPGLMADKNVTSVVFLCDASGSMLVKFSALKRELSKAIQGLKPTQSFSIHFFRDTRALSLGPQLWVATPENKLHALDFLEAVAPRGTTDPLPALEIAFKQKPQLIFLLTDGDFPDNDAVLNRIRQLNRGRRVKIDTIAFVGEADTDTGFIALLKRIAAENGGLYRHVREDEVE